MESKCKKEEIIQRSSARQLFAAGRKFAISTRWAANSGISSSLVRKWKNELDREGENAFPGKGHLSDEETLLIKRENARLKEENTILKKAMGYFADRPR